MNNIDLSLYENLKEKIEAILFIGGEDVKIKDLSR